jgi:hypothetical protein
MLFDHTDLAWVAKIEEFGLFYLQSCIIIKVETQIDFALHNCDLEVYSKSIDQRGKILTGAGFALNNHNLILLHKLVTASFFEESRSICSNKISVSTD